MKASLCMLLIVLCASLCFGQVFQPGFRTVGSFEEEPPTRLDINIWYPTTRQPKDLSYPPWLISAALNAKPADGKFPLLLLSHASPGDRFAYHELAAWLACEGFIVVSPTHRRDFMDNMDDLFTWPQLETRVANLSLAIDLAFQEKDIAAVADRARIGLIGFGSGATAALLMGGALPECSSWPGFCALAGDNDPYCSSWAKERISTLCQSFPLRKSLANPEIKAIAAIAPGFGMIFDAASFRYFNPPLLLVAAGKDNFNKGSLHCGPIAKFLGQKARILDLPEADAGALISTCSSQLAQDLPELCSGMDSNKKAAIQSRLAETLLAFFSHYLLITANLPKIPGPPDLEPQVVSEEPKPVARKEKRRVKIR